MSKTRVEAFSDVVLAIIITIMVLELKAPHGDMPDAAPALAAGILEFLSLVYIGWHLLEQPSPPAACRAAGERRGFAGQPALALAVLA